MHKFLVKNQRIETLERDVIASDQIAFVNIKFVFDGSWKTLHKVVQFTQCDETYNRVLGNDGTSCLLPTELHAGTVKMSVFGYDTQGLRATTVPVTLHIRPSGFVGDDTPIPPTPDLYAQLLQKMEELIAGGGETVDLSAYATKEYADNKAIQWNDRLTYEVQELTQTRRCLMLSPRIEFLVGTWRWHWHPNSLKNCRALRIPRNMTFRCRTRKFCTSKIC